MILADIRIQFILVLFAILAGAGAVLPDRFGRGAGRFVMIAAGICAFVFLAIAPQFHAGLAPLPTGAAAQGNVWVWLAHFRDRPSVLSLTACGCYAVVGLGWAVAHFWLYARRLGQVYVMERDTWLSSCKRTNLEGLSAAERAEFEQVLAKVRRSMLYSGDFPLAPLQQKRFFVANTMLWPLTLSYYVLGDLALDAARYVWFALRKWIHRRWEAGMTEYLADDALCRALMRPTAPSA